MSRVMRDGWHRILGHDVYVEDGKIIRGTNGTMPTYPYWWNRQANVWTCCKLTEGEFRYGIKRGTVEMK